MRGVVVPAGVDRVAHDVANLRKHVLDQGLVAAERDPLAQFGGHAHHQALTGAQHPAQLLVLAPALQLSEHGLQLEVARLLVQQTVVLKEAKDTFESGNRFRRLCLIVALVTRLIMNSLFKRQAGGAERCRPCDSSFPVGADNPVTFLTV